MYFYEKLSVPFVLILMFVLNVSAASEASGKMLSSPEMILAKPSAGKRVRQVAPEYKGTNVYHALYLPVDWKPGGKYPVIVEYTGNRWSPGKSTGRAKDANLGYGMSGGKGFIWVSMPYVEKDGKTNALNWWGSIDATVEYCKLNVPRICNEFGGDPNNVFICGFSRGAIGASYIGLANDEIAKLWKGLFTHDYFDGAKKWSYPNSNQASALKRLARLKGRLVLVSQNGLGRGPHSVPSGFLKDHLDLAKFTFISIPVTELFDIPEGKVVHQHTDLWMHKESKYRKYVRGWLKDAVNETKD